jgi:hypothetical protein
MDEKVVAKKKKIEWKKLVWSIAGIAAMLLGAILGIIYYTNFGFDYAANKNNGTGTCLLIITMLCGVAGVVLGVIGLLKSEDMPGYKELSGWAVMLSIFLIMMYLLWLLSSVFAVASV